MQTMFRILEMGKEGRKAESKKNNGWHLQIFRQGSYLNEKNGLFAVPLIQ